MQYSASGCYYDHNVFPTVPILGVVGAVVPHAQQTISLYKHEMVLVYSTNSASIKRSSILTLHHPSHFCDDGTASEPQSMRGYACGHAMDRITGASDSDPNVWETYNLATSTCVNLYSPGQLMNVSLTPHQTAAARILESRALDVSRLRANMTAVVSSLRKQIAACEATLQELRQQLAEAEQNQNQPSKVVPQKRPLATDPTNPLDHDMNFGVPDDFRSEVFAILDQGEKKVKHAESEETQKWELEKDEYKRYGRQLIMPEIGLQGQLRLKSARVLIVGVGGLGCPAAAYLVGAGVGTVGLVDGDVVEESNLHRQILHSTARVGMTKVESAMVGLKSLNPNVNLVPHISRLSPETAISTFSGYDLVLDCTDTPASRYLISDACVLLGKPLVSASALRIDGQLMVLNNPPLPPGDLNGGPCYRCVFPKPPPPESVVSCGDGGILGPVVGVMGVLQALEAIKVLTQKTPAATPADPPSLLIFSAYSNPMFRSIRLRSRKAKCASCSANATVTKQALEYGNLDYVQFCGSVLAPDNLLSPEERISAQNYARLRSGVNPHTGTVSNRNSHILVDVREKVQFELCHIDGSMNVPFSTVSSTPGPSANKGHNGGDFEENDWVTQLKQSERPIFVICRLGNDSQVTVKKMKELGLDLGGKRYIGDIKGGLQSWRKDIETDFPDY